MSYDINGKFTRIRFYDRVEKVQFLDPGSPGDRLFVMGEQFGVTHLILAGCMEDAYDEWMDSQPTIPASELWQAHGFSSPETYQEFCRLFEMQHKEEAWAIAKSEGIEGGSVTVPEDFPALIEGFEYQPNFSGTGVVNVSEYLWIHLFKEGKNGSA